mmetsp:Transcript_43328/g.133827  ORF Transcript_43328/g.133827 Transcript_43328/m.133827 type:complete len:340 (-) Transcript_43328:2092-3111(-)
MAVVMYEATRSELVSSSTMVLMMRSHVSRAAVVPHKTNARVAWQRWPSRRMTSTETRWCMDVTHSPASSASSSVACTHAQPARSKAADTLGVLHSFRSSHARAPTALTRSWETASPRASRSAITICISTRSHCVDTKPHPRSERAVGASGAVRRGVDIASSATMRSSEAKVVHTDKSCRDLPSRRIAVLTSACARRMALRRHATRAYSFAKSEWRWPQRPVKARSFSTCSTTWQLATSIAVRRRAHSNAAAHTMSKCCTCMHSHSSSRSCSAASPSVIVAMARSKARMPNCITDWRSAAGLAGRSSDAPGLSETTAATSANRSSVARLRAGGIDVRSPM